MDTNRAPIPRSEADADVLLRRWKGHIHSLNNEFSLCRAASVKTYDTCRTLSRCVRDLQRCSYPSVAALATSPFVLASTQKAAPPHTRDLSARVPGKDGQHLGIETVTSEAAWLLIEAARHRNNLQECRERWRENIAHVLERTRELQHIGARGSLGAYMRQQERTLAEAASLHAQDVIQTKERTSMAERHAALEQSATKLQRRAEEMQQRIEARQAQTRENMEELARVRQEADALLHEMTTDLGGR
ncbi:unnamed protein product [Vitrella brassicaformis CCMP3155]|uniref:Uncharacterized protein n=1 Tax=Vitrella brassicaformis (strain CCMP3155) TaxID=1169540 RepID=A0A0G4H4R7_VITBC|nr:unnamed protein product [Vitrella brassicaformis CCMP3155]|eukprot:CEM38777.1 unnamed protein product [Vitrella brassicaformis CCMP3155]